MQDRVDVLATTLEVLYRYTFIAVLYMCSCVCIINTLHYVCMHNAKQLLHVFMCCAITCKLVVSLFSSEVSVIGRAVPFIDVRVRGKAVSNLKTSAHHHFGSSSHPARPDKLANHSLWSPHLLVT